VRAYKISKRFDCDISAVCASLAIELSGPSGSERIAAVRLAFGGMAATVRRAALAEAAMQGQAWSEASLQAAMAALAQDFKPLSDMRASSEYRMQVAQNLLKRFWLETRAQAALPESAVSVWSREEVL
jgi:xanthine dehydrogenase small subunit